MNIVVVVKMVPDLVEELAIDASGVALDTSWLRMIISEFDDHATEQAILLKERTGGQVTVVTPAVEDVDQVLFAAAARGADRLVKIGADWSAGSNNHALGRAVARLVGELQPDLVLTGVGSHNDLDGALGPLLAEYAGLPYVGYVAGLALADGTAVARKEYPGGLIGEVAVTLPAVLGVQAAEQPPRYVAVSKVRQAMQTATIEEWAAGALDSSGGPAVGRMYLPESGERATMIEGDEDEVAAAMAGILQELGVL